MLEPVEIDADDLTGWLYWTDRALGTIARSRPDGTEPEFVIGDPDPTGPFIGGNLHAPYGISVDAANNFLYWSEKSVIRRARLDGSEITDVVNGLTWPSALEVFPEEDLIFWTLESGGTFRSAPGCATTYTFRWAATETGARVRKSISSSRCCWAGFGTERLGRLSSGAHSTVRI